MNAWQLVAALLGGTNILSLLMYRIRRKGAELDNLDKATQIWKRLNGALETRVNDLEKEVKNLKALACYRKDCPTRQKSE